MFTIGSHQFTESRFKLATSKANRSTKLNLFNMSIRHRMFRASNGLTNRLSINYLKPYTINITFVREKIHKGELFLSSNNKPVINSFSFIFNIKSNILKTVPVETRYVIVCTVRDP